MSKMVSHSKRLWKTRSYRKSDMVELLELTKIVTGEEIHVDRWQWLFEQSPGGKGIFRLGDHEGRIVGQYVIVPQRMMIDGQAIRGALSCETMTHPQYRRQGVFVSLAKDVFAESVNQGISIVYGFPNNNSYHGFVNRLGFAHFAVPFHMRPLRGGRLFRKKFPMGWLGELMGSGGQWFYDRIFYSREVEPRSYYRLCVKNHLDDSFDDLWERSKSMFSNMIVRDYSYVRWRYMDKVNPPYTILGAEDLYGTLRAYLVFRCFFRNNVYQGHIFDILSDPDGVNLILPLVKRCLQIMRKEGAEVAVCLLLKKSLYLSTLKKLGFFTIPNKSLPFIFHTNTPQVKEANISDPSRWHITLGDSDFV